MTLLGLAAASFRHRKWRVASTLFAMALSGGALTMTIAVVTLMRDATKVFELPYLDSTSTNPFDRDLPFKHVAAVKRLPGLGDGVQPEYARFLGAAVGDQIRFNVTGASDGYPSVFPKSFYEPDSAEVHSRWAAERDGVIVVGELMNQLGLKVGDPVTVQTVRGEVRGKVVGHAHGAMPEMMIFHYETLEGQIPAEERGRINQMIIPAPFDRQAELASLVDQAFKTSGDPTFTLSFADSASIPANEASTVPRLLILVGIIFNLMTLTIAASVVSSSLRERKREFATLRAIGFRKPQVLGLMMLEAVTLCTAGSLLGALACYAAFSVSGLHLGEFIFSEVKVTPEALAAAVLTTATLAALIGLLPAVKQAQQNVVRALSDP
jgi:putative ABC transport system permease protein